MAADNTNQPSPWDTHLEASDDPWGTHLAQLGDLPTQPAPERPSYYNDLPEMERNKTPKDRTVSVLSDPIGVLPYLRAGVEARNRGESFWGGTPQYERERKALQQYYNQAHEDAPDSIKVLSQIGFPGGPMTQAGKYLTSAARPIESGAAMGMAQAGVAGYLSPIEPATNDWRARLESAAEAMPLGVVMGGAAGAAGHLGMRGNSHTTPEENAAFIERTRNSTPEEIQAFIKGMGEPSHEGAWDYADPQLEAPQEALPAPEEIPQEHATAPEEPPPPEREVDPLGYYSHALEAAKTLKQEKGTPGQRFKMLTDAPGVREAEILTTGIHRRILGNEGAQAYEHYLSLRNEVDAARQELTKKGIDEGYRHPDMSDKEWAAEKKALINNAIGQPVQDLAQAQKDFTTALRGAKGTITRDDIVDYLRNMRPILKQKVRGERPDSLTLGELNDRRFPAYYPVLMDGEEVGTIVGNHNDTWSPTTYSRFGPQYSTPDAALNHFINKGFVKSDTKWRKYTLDPDDPTYRETTIYLPPDLSPGQQKVYEAIQDKYLAERNALHLAQNPTEWEPEVSDATRVREQAKMDDINRRENEELVRTFPHHMPPSGEDNLYTSGHFPEPNITGHLMTSQVELPDGTKAFNVHQIQSDWGQTLRDEGVRDEAKIARLAEAHRQAAQAADEADNKARSFLRYNPSLLQLKMGEPYPPRIPINKAHEIQEFPFQIGNWKGTIVNPVGTDEWAVSAPNQAGLHPGPISSRQLFPSLQSAQQKIQAEFFSLPPPELLAHAITEVGSAPPEPRDTALRDNLWHLRDDIRRSEDHYELTHAELNTARNSAAGHPLVNTTDQWVSTTLRKALEQAVNSGSDAITIPTGDTVLSYNPGDKHGMNDFYNKIVPKNLSKILKEYDPKAPASYYTPGVKTHNKDFANKGDRYDYEDSPHFGFKVFPLTNKIKEAVKRGQKMFKHGGSVLSHSEEPNGGEVTHEDYSEHLPEHERSMPPEEAHERAKWMIPYLRAGSESVKRGGSFWGGDEPYEHQLKALQQFYHGNPAPEAPLAQEAAIAPEAKTPERKHGGPIGAIASAFEKRLDGRRTIIEALEKRHSRNPSSKLAQRIEKERDELRRIEDHLAKVKRHV